MSSGSAGQGKVGQVKPGAKLVLALLGSALLAGCSSDGEAQRLLREVGAMTVPGVTAGPVPTARYAALVEAGAPQRLVTREETGETWVLRRLARSGDGVETWISPEDIGFSFRGPMLVSTRGVGGDLLASDSRQTWTLLNAGQSGSVERFHSYLDGNNSVQTHSYVCTVGPDGNDRGVMQEDCTGTEESFVSSYQLNAAGGARSRQYVSPQAGTFIINGNPS